MVLVVTGAVGVTALVMMEHAEQLPRLSADMLQSATLALNAGGEPSLHEWLKKTHDERQGLHVFVLDEVGHDLLDRPVPVRLQKQQPGQSPVAVRPDGGAFPPTERETLVAPNGRQYVLTIVPARHHFEPFTLPETRLATLLLALAATGVASWLLTRSVTRPVRALAAATRSLAHGQLELHLDPRVSARRDEIGALGRDFEAMASRLRALLQSRERLLCDVSHELRSPLARMRVALGLARQPGADVVQQLQRLEGEIERLDRLIGQVLRLSRLDAAEGMQLTEVVDLVELIDGIARDAAFEAQGRSIKIHWQPPAKPYHVKGSSELLASAIENIVRNGIAYSAAGDVIWISLRQKQDLTEIAVRDHGPGVPEADLLRIFEPFYRVAESRARDIGGDGIGLAITARVLRAHGGMARAYNEPDGGLVVTLTLPTHLGAVTA
jgi:two-component system sensor histidine kinase CpxA